MLTGGLRTRAQFANAIQNGDAQLIGMARHAILQPDLPRLLESLVAADSKHDEYAKLNDKVELWEGASLPEPRSPAWWPRLVGAGVGMAWYTIGMRRIYVGEQLPIGRWWVLILLEMYFGASGVRILLGVMLSSLFITVGFLVNKIM